MREVSVIGCGPGDPRQLTVAAWRAIEAADLVIGSGRLVAAVRAEGLAADGRAEAVTTARPSEVVAAVASTGEGARVAVLVSGDTGFHSAAARLDAAIREVPGTAVHWLPGVGSLPYLAARLGRAWDGWALASAHGRSCDLDALLAEGRTFALLTDASCGPARVCASLVARGLGALPVTVGERLSAPDERITSGTAAELAARAFDPLSVMVVDRAAPADPVADGRAPEGGQVADPWPYATTGIPDELFAREDVPMTKAEVRAVALAKLGVAPRDVVYDVGCGTGSVTVELARLARRGTVYGVDANPRAVALTRRNLARFGCANARVVEGAAPDALEPLPAPDAVFVGGTSGGVARILAAVAARNPRVRVCVTAIALESAARALEALAGEAWADVTCTQVGVARARAAGGLHMMLAQNPILVIAARGSGRAPHADATPGDVRAGGDAS